MFIIDWMVVLVLVSLLKSLVVIFLIFWLISFLLFWCWVFLMLFMISDVSSELRDFNSVMVIVDSSICSIVELVICGKLKDGMVCGILLM